MQENPVLWGWVKREDRLMPNWQLNEPSVELTIYIRHMHALVNEEVVSVVKVA